MQFALRPHHAAADRPAGVADGLRGGDGVSGFPAASELEQGSKTLSAYADRHLTNPREFQVELEGLNDKRFACFPSAAAA